MDQNPASPEARQSHILESLVDRLWQRSRERGRCERAATIDTLILLSLCGRTFFFKGVEILRRRELILGDVGNYQGPRVIGRVRRRTPVTPRITRIQQQILSADTIRLQAQDERAQRIISSLPCRTVSETPQAVEDPTCIICMDPLGLNAEVMVLPCAHWFCADCTGSWFRVVNSCLMCREAVGPNQPHNRPTDGASEPTDTPVELANDLTIDEGLLYGDYHPPYDDALAESRDIDEDLLIVSPRRKARLVMRGKIAVNRSEDSFLDERFKSLAALKGVSQGIDSLDPVVARYVP